MLSKGAFAPFVVFGAEFSQPPRAGLLPLNRGYHVATTTMITMLT